MNDVFGEAMLDFYHKRFKPPLLLHNNYGPTETVSIELFFANQNEFSDLECFALEQTRGKILDIGAASGRHSLYLQSQDKNITALDSSSNCGSIMEEIGIKKIVIEDIYQFKGEQFDTMLMLMNGIGIAGNINGLKQLLGHLQYLLTPGGQVLLDSTDISYVYEKHKLPDSVYYGELTFQYEYKGKMGNPINWLYIDQELLAEIAHELGWQCQVIFEDETGAYLASLRFL